MSGVLKGQAGPGRAKDRTCFIAAPADGITDPLVGVLSLVVTTA